MDDKRGNRPFLQQHESFHKRRADLREVKFTVGSFGKRVEAGIPGTVVLYNHALKQKDLLPEWADIALTVSFF
ncbi:MAG: hypothetical protein LWX01_13365 [Deltaproteobacteria bacterium]|nr:hypothetical protein [Deltaproteobacteria bacterium]MDL1962652.1 hypothetical protein [Deltaproteobacteria bacterium]